MHIPMTRMLLCSLVLTMASCQQEVTRLRQDGGDADSLLLGDGAPCDNDVQCENAFCMPSINSFGLGYCYGLGMTGCIVVGEPSPFKTQCQSNLKTLFVCGESWDVAQLGTCAELGQGAIGERYHCCEKP